MYCCRSEILNFGNIKFNIKNIELAKLAPYMSDKYELTNDLLNKFANLSVVERIKYLEEELLAIDIVYDVVHLDKVEDKKDNDYAQYELNKSAEFVKQFRYRQAFEAINSAICLSNGSFINKCYLLRSDIFFKMHLLDECSYNLTLVTMNELTKKQNDILKNTKLKIIKAREENEWLLPKPLNPTHNQIRPRLHCGPHPLIPFVDKCVEFDYDYDNGLFKSIRCKSDLKAGDILVIEDELCPILFNDERYGRCEHCFNDNYSVLIPCKHCTKTMFCNVGDEEGTCYEKAWDLYHKYECPIIKILNMIHPFRTVLRLLITSFQIPSEIDDFIRFTNTPGRDMFNPFTIDWKNLPHNHLVKLIYSLNAAELNITSEQKYLYTRWTALIVLLLLAKTNLPFDRFNTPDRLNFMREFIYRYFLICSNNLHIHLINHNYRFSYENQSFTRSMLSVRLMQSFLPHSCEANVKSASYGLDKSIIFARRPIQRGSELCIDILYKKDLPPDYQIKELKSQLNHTCDCFADKTNIKFPCMTSKRKSNDFSMDTILSEIDKMYLLNSNNVMDLFNLANQYLTDHDYEYPSYELYLHNRVVELCLQRLYGLPIVKDVGTEYHYEIYNLNWLYSTVMFDKSTDFYRKIYGHIPEKIRRQIFEFLKKNLKNTENSAYKIPKVIEPNASRQVRSRGETTFPIMKKIFQLDMVLPTERFRDGVTVTKIYEKEARTFLETNCSEMGFEFNVNVYKNKRRGIKKKANR